jgi:AhpD family alkylhydroperoxidase
MPYQDPSDFRLLPEMARLARPEAEAFLAFDKAAGRGDGAIPPKYRELIALAVGLTTQCAYCLDVHTGRALEAGATREELAEVAFIAASLRAGATLGHGLMMLRLAEQGGRPDRTAPE